MNIPQKTPRLKIRIVSESIAAEFQAATFAQFKKRYNRALRKLAIESNVDKAHIRNLFYKNTIVSTHDDHWAYLQVLPISEQANRAQDGKEVRINNLDEYDLQLAVLKAGSAKEWFYSDEGIWVICQAEWLWGKELSEFTGDVAADVFDDIAKDKEQYSGEFEVRIIRDYKKN